MALGRILDFSAGRPGGKAIADAGFDGVARYLSRDWRGITGPEVQDYNNHGLKIVTVYESTELRPLAGIGAGHYDAEYAQGVLEEVALPHDHPIYFAGDFDFSPEQQGAINSYVKGTRERVGLPRNGFYAGSYVLDRTFAAGDITYGWQTIAWSRDANGNLITSPHAHVLQDVFGYMLDGVNCDINEVLKADFGQNPTPAPPPPPSEPLPARITWRRGDVGDYKIGHTRCLAFLARVHAARNVTLHATATEDGPVVGHVSNGEPCVIVGSCRGKRHSWYFVQTEHGFGRALRSGFTERYPLPEAA